MISKGLVERIYESASIQRWNEYVRPTDLTELDKQAHKMVIAYLLAKSEECEGKNPIHWVNLIEGGIFEFLQRVVLTDLKPAIYHQLMLRKGRELNEWVLRELDADISGIKGGFARKFRLYFSGDDQTVERRILKAAHYLATLWEFRIVYSSNRFIYDIEQTKQDLENQLEDHYHLIGVQKISLGKKSSGLIDLCGQLRFQQRWAQSPRLPKTSVLGHMLIVALFSYFAAIEMGSCPKRIYNNFFSALFHDLPEVLTRDIVSPVKSSVAGLQEIIAGYEDMQIEERVLPLLPVLWHEEFRYFVQEPFVNKIIKDGAVLKDISNEEINEHYNQDYFAPLDGKVLKACDHLAAFIEASLSMQHGVRSKHLLEGKRKLAKMYQEKTIAGLDFGKVFGYFADDDLA